MARQYSLPEGRDRNDPRGKTEVIRRAAVKYGIDPEIALKVARSEGLRDFLGDGGKSGGAFQLYTGGGLGNKFQKETGLSPLDPKNEDATIDFAMREAAKTGWKPWHGAAKVGVNEWDGIGGGAVKTADNTAPPADTTIKGTDTSTVTPDVAPSGPQAAAAAPAGGFLDKLKDARGGASEGLGEAISGLGAALTGASPNAKNMYTTPVPQATPIAPTPAPPNVVPAVNPQVAEQQRQQLALAMQRLNTGRLF